MTSNVISWEQQLLKQAYAALENSIPTEPIVTNQSQLKQAYAYCAAMTSKHSRTFYLASGLLPPAQRRAARALYAFCRVSDDLVDCASENQYHQLYQWRQRSLVTYPATNDLVALAWADTRAKYHIPRQYAEQLLDGVAQDLTTKRYATFTDLVHYCYGVASTVGLMTMHIIGYTGKEAIPYAIKLGVALQLTNILRDVGEDWSNGRFYLPQDELAAFNLTEADIAQSRVDHHWQNFMRFQIARARRLYAEALPGVAMLNRQGRFAIAAAAELYSAILTEIEANNYDVFNHRAYTTGGKKLQMLPGIWWRAQTNSYADYTTRFEPEQPELAMAGRGLRAE